VGTVLVTERDSLGIVVVEVRGAVDPTAAAQLRSALVRAIRHLDPTRVVVDLRHAGHIEPEGIGVVVAGADVASDSGVSMTVRDAAPDVAEELLVAGLPRAQLGTAAGV
jgi:anti-anti-sigma factor